MRRIDVDMLWNQRRNHSIRADRVAVYPEDRYTYDKSILLTEAPLFYNVRLS